MKNIDKQNSSFTTSPVEKFIIEHFNIDMLINPLIDYIFKKIEERCKQKRWLSPKELQKEYGFELDWQKKARLPDSSIKIPFHKIGRLVKYDRQKIDEWIKNCEIQGVE